MRICIGSDHGGFLLKVDVIKYLESKGISVIDKGCDSVESVHYPLYANMVCEEVENKTCDYGILICTSGFGMCIVANKHKDIRSAVIRTKEEAFLSRSHNDCNVLCLGAKFTSLEDAKEIIDTFLATEFAGGRHSIRVNMIKELEDK